MQFPAVAVTMYWATNDDPLVLVSETTGFDIEALLNPADGDQEYELPGTGEFPIVVDVPEQMVTSGPALITELPTTTFSNSFTCGQPTSSRSI
jgi:hypothetical protein